MKSPHRKSTYSPEAELGYVLVDALVGLVIATISICTFSVALHDALVRSRSSDYYEHAALVAESVMSNLGGQIPIRAGVTSGIVDGMNWTLTISPIEPASGSVMLNNVDLEVRAGSAGPTLEVDSRRIGPA